MAPFPLGIMALAGAGGATPTFDWLETATGTGVSSVTFSGLNAYWADYAHLEIRMTLLGSLQEVLQMRINGVSSSIYGIQYIKSTGSGTPQIYNNWISSYFELGEAFGKSNWPDRPGSAIIRLQNFSDNPYRVMNYTALDGLAWPQAKQVRASAGVPTGITNATSIELSISNGLMDAARFSIYGVN